MRNNCVSAWGVELKNRGVTTLAFQHGHSLREHWRMARTIFQADAECDGTSSIAGVAQERALCLPLPQGHTMCPYGCISTNQYLLCECSLGIVLVKFKLTLWDIASLTLVVERS